MDDPEESMASTSVRVVGATPAKRRGGASMIFAVVGIVVALAAGGLYLLKESTQPPARTPEETIQEFLSAVFLANDSDRVKVVVCASWDPADALTRTSSEIDPDAHVSWDEVRVISITEGRVSARARLGVRLRDDIRPSHYRQWRFSLVNENGWRVCEARPFIV